MFCSKCGKQAEGDFCWNCGAKLYKPETDTQTAETKSVEIKSESEPQAVKAAEPEIGRKPVSFTKFKATRKYANIQFDDVHQIIAVGSENDISNNEIGQVTYLRYSEILNAEVKCKYLNVSKTSTGSMVGRAAVGALFSPASAIIGGSTAKRVEEQQIESVSISITTSNVRFPLVHVNYWSGAYYGEAELVCGVLQQVKLVPPTEEAFELTQKWGAGNTPLKADYSPRPQSKKSEPISEPWRCSSCDYKNPASSSVCLNCSAPKSKSFSYIDQPHKSSYLSDMPEDNSKSETWYCPDCDYKNNGGKSCRNCGAERPEQKVKKSFKLFGKK